MTREDAVRLVLDALYRSGATATQAADILTALGVTADETDMATGRASV